MSVKGYLNLIRVIVVILIILLGIALFAGGCGA